MEERRTSVFENGLIWFGAGVSIAEIITGTYLASLGFAKGFAAHSFGGFEKHLFICFRAVVFHHCVHAGEHYFYDFLRVGKMRQNGLGKIAEIVFCENVLIERQKGSVKVEKDSFYF